MTFPDAHEEFRVITTFEPFVGPMEHGAMRTLTNHTNRSLTFSTLEGAEENAEGMCRLALDGRIRPIKEQRIEHRLVTDWAEVPAELERAELERRIRKLESADHG